MATAVLAFRCPRTRLVMESGSFLLLLLVLLGLSVLGDCQGTLKCECSTEDCAAEGRSSCQAAQYCYVENFQGEITRGCIDERTPLLCENRKPHGMVGPWPLMYCCKNRNFCNRHALPTPEPAAGEEDTATTEPDTKDTKASDCSGSKDAEPKTSSSGPRIINPIYIAVPVAGVCVLLALIIFAMYLLRRRGGDYYETYQHYHDQHGHALQAPRPCTCKKTGACAGKVNRCTDSERSSSGSETRLFLQA